MKFAIAVVAAVVAEAVLGGDVSIGGARPQFALIAACLPALRPARGRDVVLAAWLIGLAKDLLTANPPGLNAAVFSAATYGVTRVKRAVTVDHAGGFAAICFCAAAALTMVSGVVTRIFVGPVGFAEMLTVGIRVGLYTGAAGAAVYALVRSWERRDLRRLRD